jgi:hypothetical protein
VILPVDVTFSFFEDNIERDNFEDHLMRTFATQLTKDLEDRAINGDDGSADPFLTLGFARLARFTSAGMTRETGIDGVGADGHAATESQVGEDPRASPLGRDRDAAALPAVPTGGGRLARAAVPRRVLPVARERLRKFLLDKPEDWYVFGTSAEDYTKGRVKRLLVIQEQAWMLEVWKRRVAEMMQKEKDIHGGLSLPETDQRRRRQAGVDPRQLPLRPPDRDCRHHGAVAGELIDQAASARSTPRGRPGCRSPRCEALPILAD